MSNWTMIITPTALSYDAEELLKILKEKLSIYESKDLVD